MSAAVRDDLAAVAAERAALGCALLGAEHADLVLDRVGETDLADPRSAPILGAVRRLRAAGLVPDVALVLGELRRSGELVGEAARSAGPYLVRIAGEVVCPSNAVGYVADVLESAARRRCHVAADRLHQAAAGGLDLLAATAADELAAVQRQLARAAEARAAGPHGLAAVRGWQAAA